jgi:hypothetical protein
LNDSDYAEEQDSGTHNSNQFHMYDHGFVQQTTPEQIRTTLTPEDSGLHSLVATNALNSNRANKDQEQLLIGQE